MKTLNQSKRYAALRVSTLSHTEHLCRSIKRILIAGGLLPPSGVPAWAAQNTNAATEPGVGGARQLGTQS